jgi:hypothetical protein
VVVVAQPPQPVVEAEPNDFQHPQQIPLNAQVRGSLSAPRDDDFFRLDARGGVLSLRIELSQADAVLEVLDRDRARLLRVQHARVIPGVACRESCFVHVSGKGPQEYVLTVTAQSPRADLELEPNDRVLDAQPLPLGTLLHGSFLGADDQDWYQVVLPPGPGSLRVLLAADAGQLEVRGGPDNALLASYRAQAGEGIFVRDLALGLANPAAPIATRDAGADAGDSDAGDDQEPDDEDDAGTPDAGQGALDSGQLNASTAPDAAVMDAAAPDAGPASYFFVLKRGDGAYALRASFEPGPPDLEAEPNDDAAHATVLGATASGYLSPRGDQDWYRIHADAPSVLQAQLTGLPEDVELAAFDAPDGGKPRQLARVAEDGGTQVLPFVALAPGDSYLRVRMRADGDDRDHLYKLSATVSLDDGSLEREPNDSVASAQPVTLPVALHGYLWPKRDVDFFRFHVPAGHEPVSITLTGPRGLDLLLRLHEIRGAKSEVIGSSAALSLVSVPLKEGDYAVEVSSPRKDGSATEPYELHVSP